MPYCQDVAELLHVGKRKTAGILRRMVRDGQLRMFEKRYYLAKQPGQKQISMRGGEGLRRLFYSPRQGYKI